MKKEELKVYAVVANLKEQTIYLSEYRRQKDALAAVINTADKQAYFVEIDGDDEFIVPVIAESSDLPMPDKQKDQDIVEFFSLFGCLEMIEMLKEYPIYFKNQNKENIRLLVGLQQLESFVIWGSVESKLSPEEVCNGIKELNTTTTKYFDNSDYYQAKQEHIIASQIFTRYLLQIHSDGSVFSSIKQNISRKEFCEKFYPLVKLNKSLIKLACKIDNIVDGIKTLHEDLAFEALVEMIYGVETVNKPQNIQNIKYYFSGNTKIGAFGDNITIKN